MRKSDVGDYTTLKVDFEEGVVRVLLNRPERLNAISIEMADELIDVAERWGHHPEVKVMVISGAGRAFSAGFDVSADIGGQPVRAGWIRFKRFQSAITAIASAPVVRIAHLHGHVVGAGILLAAACEMRVGDPTTTISVPELDMGIPFSLGGPSTLARLIGLTRASDLILTGRRMYADEALAAGFLSEVVEAEDAPARVAQLATQIAQRPDSLLLATLVSLGEAARDLLPADTIDLATMQFAANDPQAAEVNAQYSARFRSGSGPLGSSTTSS